jgi:hypothetical protein
VDEKRRENAKCRKRIHGGYGGYDYSIIVESIREDRKN